MASKILLRKFLQNFLTFNKAISMSPKISVILPVYNTENYVSNALESLAAQTFKDFEVLCIDDGSTDQSLKILKDFSSSDPRFKCISKSNEGLSATRNLGIKLAQGEILLFVDSDDQIESSTLEVCYNQIVNNNLDILFFDAQSVYESEDLKEKFTWYQNAYTRSKEYNEILSGEEMFNKMMSCGDYIVSACMYAISKKLIQSNNLSFVRGILYEDNIFTYKALISASRVKHVKKPFYIRLVRKNSIVTKQVTAKNLDSYFRCYSEIYFFAKDNVSTWKTQKNTSQLLSSLQRHMLKQANALKDSNYKCNLLDKSLVNFLNINKRPQNNFEYIDLCIKTFDSLKSHGIRPTMTKIQKFLSRRKK